MKLKWIAALILAFHLASPSAAPAADVRTEVDFLLGYVDGSGCEFYRNGNWYGAKAAQLHLREKHSVLAAMGLIGTAEDFIDKAGTKSSISGNVYEVRCGRDPVVTSRKWLTDALLRWRARQ